MPERYEMKFHAAYRYTCLLYIYIKSTADSSKAHYITTKMTTTTQGCLFGSPSKWWPVSAAKWCALSRTSNFNSHPGSSGVGAATSSCGCWCWPGDMSSLAARCVCRAAEFGGFLKRNNDETKSIARHRELNGDKSELIVNNVTG